MKKILLLLTTFVYFGCTDDTSELLSQQSDLTAVQTRSEDVNYTSGSKDVCFGLSDEYDNGVYPNLAVNSKQMFLEVHQSSYANPKVWYHLGTANGMTVDWSGSTFLDNGFSPSVALNDSGFAIEAHRAPTMTPSWDLVKLGWFSYYKMRLSYKTWYHFGTLSDDKISWGGSIQYGEGEEPDVALNKTYCVEVHRTGTNLYYKVGLIDAKAKKIFFEADNRFAENYTNPKIAINSANSVIVCYSNALGKMCYRTGKIVDGKTISWGTETTLGLGVKCDIALADDGSVVSVYTLGGQLYRKSGNLNTSGNNISWSNSGCFDEGTIKTERFTQCNPTVAIAPDASMVIQAHSSLAYNLKYSTSLFLDRMNWMRVSNLGGKTMKEMCLPGSHDAGTFSIDKSSERILYSDGVNYETDPLNVAPVFAVAKYAKTQDKTMLEQLKNGIRYFDLRPYYKGSGDTIYAHHALVGESFKVMLNDLRTFLNSTSGEIVVIKLSAFNNFYKSNASNPNEITSEKTHAVLAEMINRYLENYMYKKDAIRNVSFQDLSYDEITMNAKKSRVFVLYDYEKNIESSFRAKYGFFSVDDINIYDDYANTTFYDKMLNDQLKKLGEQALANRFNLLSWTLTISEKVDEAINGYFSAGDLSWLSNQCNFGLARFTAKYGKKYRMNILYTDYSERARTTDCAIMLNKAY